MMRKFVNLKELKIKGGELTNWNWDVHYMDRLNLSEKTDLGTFTYINAKSGISIGDFVQIGCYRAIYSESTIDGKNGSVVLKKNCKIGCSHSVMLGVTVVKNSILAVQSFVNKDVPANVVVLGFPAKIIKRVGE